MSCLGDCNNYEVHASVEKLQALLAMESHLDEEMDELERMYQLDQMKFDWLMALGHPDLCDIIKQRMQKTDSLLCIYRPMLEEICAEKSAHVSLVMTMQRRRQQQQLVNQWAEHPRQHGHHQLGESQRQQSRFNVQPSEEKCLYENSHFLDSNCISRVSVPLDQRFQQKTALQYHQSFMNSSIKHGARKKLNNVSCGVKGKQNQHIVNHQLSGNQVCILYRCSIEGSRDRVIICKQNHLCKIQRLRMKRSGRRKSSKISLSHRRRHLSHSLVTDILLPDAICAEVQELSSRWKHTKSPWEGIRKQACQKTKRREESHPTLTDCTDKTNSTKMMPWVKIKICSSSKTLTENKCPKVISGHKEVNSQNDICKGENHQVSDNRGKINCDKCVPSRHDLSDTCHQSTIQEETMILRDDIIAQTPHSEQSQNSVAIRGEQESSLVHPLTVLPTAYDTDVIHSPRTVENESSDSFSEESYFLSWSPSKELLMLQGSALEGRN